MTRELESMRGCLEPYTQNNACKLVNFNRAALEQGMVAKARDVDVTPGLTWEWVSSHAALRAGRTVAGARAQHMGTRTGLVQALRLHRKMATRWQRGSEMQRWAGKLAA